MERLTEVVDEMYVEYAATVAATCEFLRDVVSLRDYRLEEISSYEAILRRIDNKDYPG